MPRKPSAIIRGARERVEARKQSASGRAEAAREKIEQAKRRAAAPVRPVVDETQATKEESVKLAKELGSPVSRVVSGGRKVASGAGEVGSALRESVKELDQRLETVQAIEADTLGMAGEDFNADFEIVDDYGEEVGMGTLGYDTVFGPQRTELEKLRQEGREKGVKAARSAYINDIKRETKEDLLEGLRAVEDRREQRRRLDAVPTSEDDPGLDALPNQDTSDMDTIESLDVDTKEFDDIVGDY